MGRHLLVTGRGTMGSVTGQYGDSAEFRKTEELAKAAIALAELRYLVAELTDAIETWDASLSGYCDGPEREAVRVAVTAVRSAQP